MTIYKPYTYWVYHKPSRKFYYGSRTANDCNTSDLWVTYFTSSKVVKNLIEKDGVYAFNTKIHKTFDSKGECLHFEYSLLNLFKAGQNPRFLNLHHCKSVEWTPERIEKTRLSHLGKSLSDSHRAAISKGLIGRTVIQSEKWKKNAALARTGLKRSDETKQKISAARRSNSKKWKFTNLKTGEMIYDTATGFVKQKPNYKYGRVYWYCRQLRQMDEWLITDD